MNLQISFEAMLERWTRGSAVVQVLKFPVALSIVIIGVSLSVMHLLMMVATIPFKLAFAKSLPVEIKLLSRDELAAWSNSLVSRLESRIAGSPELDAINSAYKRTKLLSELFTDLTRPIAELKNVAHKIVFAFNDNQDLAIVELIWLAKHIEKWAEHNSHSEID